METKFSSPFLGRRRKEFYILMLCLQRMQINLPVELIVLIFKALTQMTPNEMCIDLEEIINEFYSPPLLFNHFERSYFSDSDDWDLD